MATCLDPPYQILMILKSRTTAIPPYCLGLPPWPLISNSIDFEIKDQSSPHIALAARHGTPYQILMILKSRTTAFPAYHLGRQPWPPISNSNHFEIQYWSSPPHIDLDASLCPPYQILMILQSRTSCPPISPWLPAFAPHIKL